MNQVQQLSAKYLSIFRYYENLRLSFCEVPIQQIINQQWLVSISKCCATSTVMQTLSLNLKAVIAVAKSYFSRIFMKMFSRTHIFQTVIFFKRFLYQYQKIYQQEFLSCKELPLQFPLKLMNHENNCKDLIWKTLILKSTCQHVKNSLNYNLRIFPNSKRIRTPNAKKCTYWSFKDIFSSILNWSTEHICHLKNDLVTQNIQLFSEYLNSGLYFLQNYCILICIQSGLQFLLNYGVRFFPMSPKLGSVFLRVCV